VKATKIFLGIPAQNATVHVGILDFLSRVRGGLFKYGDRMFDIECGFVAHVSPIEGARNVLVRNFLNSDCDHLLFVDADVYPAETGLMILDAIDKADIITGRVTIWMPTKDKEGWVVQPTAATKIENDYKHVIYDVGKGPIRYDIGGAGTGCLLVSRKVLEDRRMWGSLTYTSGDGTVKTITDDEPPPVFRTTYRPNGQRILGEDYHFTSTAKSLGYTLAYVPYAYWHHVKPVSLLEVEKYGNMSYENGFRFAQQNAALERTG
jgi:hypothetical protein